MGSTPGPLLVFSLKREPCRNFQTLALKWTSKRMQMPYNPDLRSFYTISQTKRFPCLCLRAFRTLIWNLKEPVVGNTKIKIKTSIILLVIVQEKCQRKRNLSKYYHQQSMTLAGMELSAKALSIDFANVNIEKSRKVGYTRESCE